MEELFLRRKFSIGRGRAHWWRKRPWQQIKTETIFLAQAVGLFARMMRTIPEAYLRREYRRRLWRFLQVRQNPGAVLVYVLHMAQHYHAHTMAKQMASGRSPVYNSY